MIEIYLVSIIAGFIIGYLTNWLAVLSLFRPRKKILGFQGLIPRYKKELAESVSENIHIVLPDYLKKVLSVPLIGNKIHSFFKNSVSKEIAKMSDKEIEKIVRHIASKELRFIEILGGIIGMVVGLIQAILIGLML